jgi:hypothetical protein
MIEAKAENKRKVLKKVLTYFFIAAMPLVASISIYNSVSNYCKDRQQEKEIIERRKEISKKYMGLSAAELRARITCPIEAEDFIESTYGPGSYCLNGARAIAYLICDNGFKPMPIVLKKNGNAIHWVCVYSMAGRYGCVDNGIIGYIPAVFRNINELVNHIEAREKLWRLSWEGIKTGLLLDESYTDPKGLKSVLEALDRDKKDKIR